MENLFILSTMNFSADLLARVRAVSPAIELVQYPTGDPARVPPDAFQKAEVLYTFNTLPRPDQAPHLRWVQLNSAGANHILGNPLLARGVTFTTTSGLHAINIGEYVMTSILAWAHRLPDLMELKREKRWPASRWDEFRMRELRGATLGVVGYGSIGREVGRLAKAFGMRLLAMRRQSPPEERGKFQFPGVGDPEGRLPDAYYPPDRLREMLAECDYVVIAVPLTPQTRKLIGEAELRAMKSEAYLVNIARGPVCDEQALVRALTEHWIGGAGLDVFEQEPLPASSPLWELPNVILTPHVSGTTLHYEQRAIDIFCENVRRYLASQPLLNAIDPAAGY